MEGRNELGEEDGEERQPGDLRAAKPALCPGGTLEPHRCPSPSSWSEIHGVWLQQLPGLPAQVPRAPEGVKRGEEKQRKKNKSVGREQLGQGLFALAWMCPRHVYSYRKSGFARRRARLLSTHTQPHPKCLGTPLSSNGWWPSPGLRAPRSPGKQRGCSPALPGLAGLSALGSDREGPHVPRPPACCAAGAKAWEWACAGIWLLSWSGKKTLPSPGCSLFPMDRPERCPWGSEGPNPVLVCTLSLCC